MKIIKQRILNKYFKNKYKKININELSNLLWSVYVHEEQDFPLDNKNLTDLHSQMFYEHLIQYIKEHKSDIFSYEMVSNILKGHLEDFIFNEYSKIAEKITEEL